MVVRDWWYKQECLNCRASYDLSKSDANTWKNCFCKKSCEKEYEAKEMELQIISDRRQKEKELWGLEKGLQVRYPENFDQCFDFFPPGGWKDIIEKLFFDLKKIDSNFKVAQVKEKFGGLRFYLNSPETDEMSKLIREAEEESLNTCEYTGRKESKIRRISTNGWIKTVCSDVEELSIKKGRWI